MQVSVTFRKMEPSDSLKEYATDKADRLKKYLAMPANVNVVLAKQKYRYIADIKVMSRGIVLRSEENTEDMYSSIDLALDKIERQARKYKDKIRRYNPVKLADEIMIRHNVVDQESLEEDEGPRIIKSSEFSAKPMSVDEAVMQMDLLGNDFFVFTNSSSREVNVVYRRGDGNFGLIEAGTSNSE
jgi:putative sigma-54 modulation protein